MTYGGNSFYDFPENQLSKLSTIKGLEAWGKAHPTLSQKLRLWIGPVWSTVMSAYLCLSASLSPELHVPSSPIWCVLPMAVHGSALLWQRCNTLGASVGLLPVLWSDNVILAIWHKITPITQRLIRKTHAIVESLHARSHQPLK